MASDAAARPTATALLAELADMLRDMGLGSGGLAPLKAMKEVAPEDF